MTLATNIEAFNASLRKFGAAQPKFVVQEQRRRALALVAKIVPRTASNFGVTRGNWQVSVNSIPSQVLDTADEKGSNTIAKAQAALSDIPPFSVVWIVNNRPQGEVLEEGLYKPPNPSTSPKALLRRAWSRGPIGSARRAQALAETGNEGGPFVKGGFSIHPIEGGPPVKHFVAVSLKEVTDEANAEAAALGLQGFKE